MVDQSGVIPHLIVDDAAAALEFYQAALGATETMRTPAKDGKRLLHAEMQVNGAKIFMCDAFPEHSESHTGQGRPPGTLGGTTVLLHLGVTSCDEAVRRAVAAGATVGIRSGAPAMRRYATRSVTSGASRISCPGSRLDQFIQRRNPCGRSSSSPWSS
jgi:PhnB protein